MISLLNGVSVNKMETGGAKKFSFESNRYNRRQFSYTLTVDLNERDWFIQQTNLAFTKGV